MPPNILLQFMHILERLQASEDAQREVLRNGHKNVWAAVYRLYVYVIHAHICLFHGRLFAFTLHIRGLFLKMCNEI